MKLNKQLYVIIFISPVCLFFVLNTNLKKSFSTQKPLPRRPCQQQSGPADLLRPPPARQLNSPVVPGHRQLRLACPGLAGARSRLREGRKVKLRSTRSSRATRPEPLAVATSDTHPRSVLGMLYKVSRVL